MFLVIKFDWAKKIFFALNKFFTMFHKGWLAALPVLLCCSAFCTGSFIYFHICQICNFLCSKLCSQACPIACLVLNILWQKVGYYPKIDLCCGAGTGKAAKIYRS
jgi:hypothetical protein